MPYLKGVGARNLPSVPLSPYSKKRLPLVVPVPFNPLFIRTRAYPLCPLVSEGFRIKFAISFAFLSPKVRALPSTPYRLRKSKIRLLYPFVYPFITPLFTPSPSVTPKGHRGYVRTYSFGDVKKGVILALLS